MANRTFDQECSVARTLELVGERWTLLIIREAFLGVRRFDAFQSRLGIARNLLATRLTRLVDNGILERRRYQERPPRDEYRLTQKGEDLFPALAALMAWGDRYTTGPEGPPTLLTHRGCGEVTIPGTVCSACNAPITARDVIARPRAADALPA